MLPWLSIVSVSQVMEEIHEELQPEDLPLYESLKPRLRDAHHRDVLHCNSKWQVGREICDIQQYCHQILVQVSIAELWGIVLLVTQV